MSRVLDTVMTKSFNDFSNALTRLEKLTMDDSGMILRRYSAQFASKLVRYTQPAKPKKQAKSIGNKAVARDINKSYASASKIYLEIRKQSQNIAEGMWKQYTAGDHAGLLSTIRAHGGRYRGVNNIIPWDGGKTHQDSRNSRGKIDKTHRSNTLISYNDRKMIKNYINEVSERVGYLKAGWISNFNPVGGIVKVPDWVKMNRGNHGFVTDKTRNGVVRLITFNHTSPQITKLFWRRGMETSMRSITKQMETEIRKTIIKQAKKV